MAINKAITISLVGLPHRHHGGWTTVIICYQPWLSIIAVIVVNQHEPRWSRRLTVVLSLQSKTSHTTYVDLFPLLVSDRNCCLGALVHANCRRGYTGAEFANAFWSLTQPSKMLRRCCCVRGTWQLPVENCSRNYDRESSSTDLYGQYWISTVQNCRITEVFHQAWAIVSDQCWIHIILHIAGPIG